MIYDEAAQHDALHSQLDLFRIDDLALAEFSDLDLLHDTYCPPCAGRDSSMGGS